VRLLQLLLQLDCTVKGQCFLCNAEFGFDTIPLFTRSLFCITS
jgi:hypothetical protein